MWILIQKKWPVLHMDATGTICKKIENQGPPYLYSITAYDKEAKSIVPVADFITTRHTSVHISTFLLVIKSIWKKYASFCSNSYEFKFPIPPLIVTDESWPETNSILEIFDDDLTILEYLNIAFEVLVKKNIIERV